MMVRGLGMMEYRGINVHIGATVPTTVATAMPSIGDVWIVVVIALMAAAMMAFPVMLCERERRDCAKKGERPDAMDCFHN
jgi:hypothetical protein